MKAAVVVVALLSFLGVCFRRPRSSYQRVVQGKGPLHFLNLNEAVCSNTLFSNTSALTSSLLFRGNSTCKILEHLVWSNTSRFQFWGPLARTNFLSALCGLPMFSTPLKCCRRNLSLFFFSVQKSKAHLTKVLLEGFRILLEGAFSGTIPKFFSQTLWDPDQESQKTPNQQIEDHPPPPITTVHMA